MTTLIQKNFLFKTFFFFCKLTWIIPAAEMFPNSSVNKEVLEGRKEKAKKKNRNVRRRRRLSSDCSASWPDAYFHWWRRRSRGNGGYGSTVYGAPSLPLLSSLHRFQ